MATTYKFTFQVQEFLPVLILQEMQTQKEAILLSKTRFAGKTQQS